MPQPRSRPSSRLAPRTSAVQTTASLLNEAFTRLRAAARAFENACGVKSLGPLHTWMRSYGSRLDTMAGALQDEGARSRKTFLESAAALYGSDACESPLTLLKEAIAVQGALLTTYEAITERLDMDAELYEVIVDQYEELGEVRSDMQDLYREYLTFWSPHAV